MAVATYPGTVSPLRGLDPFGEAERDVWQGREAERDELARMVTADGFRAGLLYGEPGVGKTSLVRAGLIPHLRDHGIVALACEDLAAPAQSFAAGLSAFGIQPNSGELPVAFITRAVSNAVQGQQFVFVVDDVDLACADERVVHELSDLFTKVVSRSAGRARFLYVCASERMAGLAALERRTGSLFPPSNRYELPRVPGPAAAQILDRVLSLSGIAADPALAEAVVRGLDRGSGLLAADLQIAALAMRDLKITSQGALQSAGGPTELESAWLHSACAATGNERSALRLCAELAQGAYVPRPADAVIRRINLDAGFAQTALGILESRGVIMRADGSGTSWMLRHEVLMTRVREHTAAARAAAKRAFDLLGSKTSTKQRLTLRELQALRTEGIAPVTSAEVDVVNTSKRYYMLIAAGIAAVPIIILIAIFVSLRGHAFFDLAPRAGGDHVLVRSGRSGLRGFSWLPGSGYGKVLADTGLTRSMVKPEVWKKIDNRDIVTPKGSWDDELSSMMAPQLAGLVDYATTGNDQTLQALQKAAKDPEDLAELLVALRPIARGTPEEVKMVEAALAMPSPTVQRAAVAAAGAAAQRRDVYQDTLVQSLTSQDAELRRIAFSAVRSLGDRGRALFQSALAHDPDASARRELLVEVAVAASTDEGGPPISNAVQVLQDGDATAPMRDHAKEQIKGAMAKDGAAAVAALLPVISQERAPADARIFALDLLREMDQVPGKADDVMNAARAAFQSHSVAVRAAALPVYAKLEPTRAGGDLTTMLDDKKLDKPLKVAAALAWGEVAGANKDAATGALDKLLKDDDGDVRAAAAEAAGKLGRVYQDKLIKMAKAENYNVRIGAAEGLANTAIAGANGPVAVDGIAQLWREKGRPRRDAAKVFAHLASKKPGYVLEYLANAAKNTEDPALHPIGVEGLCAASFVGSPDARRALARSTDDPSVEVRRAVMSCVADGPDPAKNGAAIAARLVRDPDGEIRADAARVLAMTVGKGKVAGGIADALVALLDDSDRDVRLIGIRAIGTLGPDAPKSAATAMTKLFERADEGEKLALLRAAKQIGAAELLGIAVADSSPLVRVAAVDAALGSGMRASATLSAALADADPSVRKAALEHLAKDKVDPQVLDRALSLAVRDPDPELSQLALTTIARVAPKEAVVARLHRSLASRIERERAQAAAAAIGLVDRDAALSVQLLEPLLDDPSHDVRVAMLPALAAAYAKTNTPEKLADLLEDSETQAMRRLAAAAAFVTLAKTDAGSAASLAALKKIAADGPPMARHSAKLVAGLIAGKADGLAFLQELVP
ncbi:MAG: hypothetical protein JO257_13585 [Deltaproteobacteria bacterium]|nr:hypothetical protein [Deltaproteobacteria bacterium]